MAAKQTYDKIIKYMICAECSEPLHIGSAVGAKEAVLVHPVAGIPFIQASSIAGVFRGYANSVDDQRSNILFGKSNLNENENAAETGSLVRFTDGIFDAGSVNMEYRPRVSIDPVSGSCRKSNNQGTSRVSGHKFNTEYVGAGASFSFMIYLYDDQYRTDIEEILAAFESQSLQFGGQKSNGCGYIKIKKAGYKEFDLKSKEGRSEWSAEDELNSDDYSILDFSKQSVRNVAYEIKVKGETEGKLLVKAIAVNGVGKGAPDSRNIQNAKREYIIPGSSLKGTIRSRMEKIADYISAPQIIEDTFGFTGNREKSGKSGNIRFYDTIVGKEECIEKMPVTNRIHIDKFTGGVMQGGNFIDKNICGDLEMRIKITNQNHPDATLGLLLMSLRDMAAGMLSVGSGYNVGKGFIAVDTIVINDVLNDRSAVIHYDGGKKQDIDDPSDIIRNSLKAVKTKEA